MIALALHALLTIPVVAYNGSRAIIDTGGVTETAAGNPVDFQTYYRGLGVGLALGANYLATHTVPAGHTRGKPKQAVKLDVRTSGSWTLAFVDCSIGGHSYRMLLDTVALAWPSAAASAPSAVLYLSSSAFTKLHSRHPAYPYYPGGEWIVNSQPAFVEAPSLTATTNCNGVVSTGQRIVERADDSTYRFLMQLFGLRVDGDASLAAFPAAGVVFDYPKRSMFLY